MAAGGRCAEPGSTWVPGVLLQAGCCQTASLGHPSVQGVRAKQQEQHAAAAQQKRQAGAYALRAVRCASLHACKQGRHGSIAAAGSALPSLSKAGPATEAAPPLTHTHILSALTSKPPSARQCAPPSACRPAPQRLHAERGLAGEQGQLSQAARTVNGEQVWWPTPGVQSRLPLPAMAARLQARGRCSLASLAAELSPFFLSTWRAPHQCRARC